MNVSCRCFNRYSWRHSFFLISSLLLWYSLYQFFIYLSSFFILLFIAFVFYKNKRTTNSYYFCCLSSSFLLWLLSYATMYSTQNEKVAYVLSHLGFTGITLIPLFSFLFLFDFSNIKTTKTIKTISVAVTALFILLTIFTNTIIATVEPNQWGSYPIAGNLHFTFLVFSVCLFLYAIYIAYKSIQRDEITSIQKQRITYLILVYSVYSILFVFDNLFYHKILLM